MNKIKDFTKEVKILLSLSVIFLFIFLGSCIYTAVFIIRAEKVIGREYVFTEKEEERLKNPELLKIYYWYRKKRNGCIEGVPYGFLSGRGCHRRSKIEFVTKSGMKVNASLKPFKTNSEPRNIDVFYNPDDPNILVIFTLEYIYYYKLAYLLISLFFGTLAWMFDKFKIEIFEKI